MKNVIKRRIQLRTGLFSSRTLEYQIRISKRATRARIKIDADGIEVVLPEHAGSDHAERMMREYSEWILKKVAVFDAFRLSQVSREENSERSILYHGKQMKIIIAPPALASARGKITIGTDRIVLPANGNSKAQAALQFQKFLKEQARKEINSMAKSLSQKMGTPYTRLTIRDQRTRWGACSARGSLSFNWRLVMSPPEVAEYVIIHELAHLIEMNHSLRFWRVVEKYCPDYKKRRLWLKKNGHLLRPDFTSLV